MIREVAEVAIASWGAGWVGWRMRGSRAHKHKHMWEVVSKDIVDSGGLSIDDALRIADASGFHESAYSIVEMIDSRKQMLVHYRCACGEEVVKRI